MRFLILFLVCFSQLLVHSQDLEFTWLSPVQGSSQGEISEFMDIAEEESGDILLTGSVGTCYGPVVVRLDTNGQVRRSGHLQIPNLGYGRAVRIYPLEGGTSVVAAWGGIADDYGGWNGHVIFLDSLFNVFARDTFETYTNPVDLSTLYRHLEIWKSGNSLSVIGLKRNAQSNYYLKRLTFDANTGNRIGTDSFTFHGSPQWSDGTFPIIPFGIDSILVGYNNKLIMYKTGILQPVYTDSFSSMIWDIARFGNHYWVLMEDALFELDPNLNVIAHKPFGGGIDRGFFITTPDSVYAITELADVKRIYSIPVGGSVADSFSISLPDMWFNSGMYYKGRGLLLAGKNNVKGTVLGVTRDMFNMDDINIIGVDYSDEHYTTKPGFVDEYSATATVTIENASAHRIDSFVVMSPTGYGINCFEYYLINSFHTALDPGATTQVTFSVWFEVIPGQPYSKSICFTAFGPNGRIDHPKVNNTLCEPLMYTEVEGGDAYKGLDVWPDWTNDRILIESPEMGAQVLTLFNVAGQRVLEKPLIEGFSEINHRLPAGLYVWQIHNQKGELIGSDKLMLH